MLSSDNIRNYKSEVVSPVELSEHERKEIAEIVIDFDKFCDNYIASILSIVNESTIVEEEVTYTKKIKVLKSKEE